MNGYETYRVTNWCRICAREFLCNKETCRGLIRWRETANFGEVRRIEDDKQQTSKGRTN